MKNLGRGSWLTRIVVLSTYVLYTNFVIVQGFESLLQLPQSGSPRIRPRSKRVLFVGDFGAKGDGLTNDTQALIDAWEIACSYPGRSRILVPSGYTFLVHPVELGGPCKSKVTLDISGNIVAPEDPAYWKGLNPRKWLYFHGIKHLTVEGRGTVSGMGWIWWARSCKIDKRNPCRHAPTAITFHKCKDLQVKNLRVIHSQQMHIAFTSCIRVMVFHLTVLAPAFSPNTDGIHISASHGIEVKDSTIRTGDDCISIVGISSRIRIRNIACGPGHGISIGSLGKSNSSSQVRDVLVDGAFLSNTDNGLRIKTWQGGSGNATNIKFQNIFMENVANPIIIDQYYCDSKVPCANQVSISCVEINCITYCLHGPQTSAVKIENISFIRIKGTSVTEEAIIFACSDDSPCEGLYLEDIRLLSPARELTKSFCWQAYGTSRGLVYPPPCFSCNESFIEQMVLSESFQSL